MPQRLLYYVNWSYDHFWNVVTGILFGILGYFAEIKGVIHLMIIAFLIDLIIGIWAAKSVRKEKFSMEKAFRAFERMAIVLIVVALLYAMDKEMKQDYISIYYIVSWAATGLLVYSIAENGLELTGGKLLIVIKSIIKKKVKETSGVDLENPEEDEQNRTDQ